MKTLGDIDFSNKRVLVRAGYDVPMDDAGNIIDSRRIKDSIPTLKYLLKARAKIIIMAHIGRPDGKAVDKLKTDKVAAELSKLLHRPVKKLDGCTGDAVISAVNRMKPREIVMLENLRFYPGEEKNDLQFAAELAKLGDAYVDEAFSNAHRAHASMVGVPALLPHAAGLSLQKEVENLTLDNPERPLVVVIGGLKIETKIPVMKQFIQKADKILVGGAMIFTFYKAMGYSTGKSIVNENYIGTAKEIMQQAGDKLVLPVDVICAKNPEEKGRNVAAAKMKEDDIGYDIGKQAVKEFSAILSSAKTVVWNGPMGFFEKKQFAKGTRKLAKLMSKLNVKVVVGGGESEEVVTAMHLTKKFTHVSTGGGASLELLSGEELPGIKALE